MIVIRKKLGLGILASAIGVAMMVGGEAQAAACPGGDFSWNTIQGAEFGGQCQDGDKLYTFISVDVLGGAPDIDAWKANDVAIDVGTLGGDANHIIEWKEWEDYSGAGDSFRIRASIEIVEPSFFDYIKLVDLDSTVGVIGGEVDVEVTKDLYADLFTTELVPAGTLTSSNGGFDVTAIPSVKKIWFEDIAVINAGELSAIENSFEQATVPEPGTLALAGLALAGLGYARKRKTARA